MKKLLLFTLLLALISIVLLSCNTQSNLPQSSDSESNESQSFERQKPYIFNMMGINVNDEQYAGSYIDNGIYHINIVGDTDDFKDQVKLDNIELHSVDYSLKYLDEVAKVLTDNMLELGISVIETSEKDNKVYIYIKDIDDSKLNRIKKVIDSPVIEAKEQVFIIKVN